MKKIGYLITLALFIFACNTEQSGSSDMASIKGSKNLANANDSISYAIGDYYSQQFKSQGIQVKAAEMAQGLKDGLTGNATMDAEQTNSFIVAYQKERAARKGKPFTEEDPVSVPMDSFSYAMGVDFGLNVKEYDMQLNAATFLQGAADQHKDGATLIDQKQIDDLLRQFSSEMQEKQISLNAEIGQKFIAEKAAEDGVQSTSSGLHYKVLNEGTGASPIATDKVKVHYHGTLIDGTVFDSSYDRGNPIDFRLDGVIKGWTEGLQLMKVGSKYQFYIPHQLAYGERGSPPNIGPGETLIFDVELLDIVN